MLRPCLDGIHVATINSRLRGKPEREDPNKLVSNNGSSCLGSKIYGQGFILTHEERDALVKQNRSNAKRLFPYLGGEEVNTSPTQSPHRHVINFEQMSMDEAEAWPDLLSIVRTKVKPERDKNKREVRKKYWWRFGEVAPALYAAIRPLPRCLVTARVAKHLIFTFQPTDRVFSEQLYVFPLAAATHFAILQSRIHEPWARLLSSSLEDRLRYAASDCFDTFPFPEPDPRTIISAVEKIGEKLYTARANYMLENDVGLTITYNRLKDPTCIDAPIETLRELHLVMDRAVLEAYGWGDIEPPPFTTPQTPSEEKAIEAFQDEVIDRLFVLNAERAKAQSLR